MIVPKYQILFQVNFLLNGHKCTELKSTEITYLKSHNTSHLNSFITYTISLLSGFTVLAIKCIEYRPRCITLP